jgi:ribosomal protein L10
MLQKGLDASLIAEITGLSVEEIEQLRKEMINAQTK